MKDSTRLVVGIDASRNRSGGAKAHLTGILSEGDPTKHGIDEVHVWTYRDLLEVLPSRPWLVKHNSRELDQSLLMQVWWQRFRLPVELKNAGCSIILNTDAGTVGRFRPNITMSRDMLSYESGEIDRFGLSRAWLRLILLRYAQNQSLRHSDGVIFLTRYAAEVIQGSCGQLEQLTYIPHGVGEDFKRSDPVHIWPSDGERPVRCLYISPVWEFKHQWVVVHAIAILRNKGYNVSLVLIGGGKGKPQRLLDDQVKNLDPQGAFVQQLGFIPQNELPDFLSKSDLFIFASSCENMPNTLLEAMAVGLPIACSSRGPMPEVLEDGGVYFDPEDAQSIAGAVEQIISDQKCRYSISLRAKTLAKQYSWARCADETWTFITKTFKNLKAAT